MEYSGGTGDGASRSVPRIVELQALYRPLSSTCRAAWTSARPKYSAISGSSETVLQSWEMSYRSKQPRVVLFSEMAVM